MQPSRVHPWSASTAPPRNPAPPAGQFLATHPSGQRRLAVPLPQNECASAASGSPDPSAFGDACAWLFQQRRGCGVVSTYAAGRCSPTIRRSTSATVLRRSSSTRFGGARQLMRDAILRFRSSGRCAQLPRLHRAPTHTRPRASARIGTHTSTQPRNHSKQRVTGHLQDECQRGLVLPVVGAT